MHVDRGQDRGLAHLGDDQMPGFASDLLVQLVVKPETPIRLHKHADTTFDDGHFRCSSHIKPLVIPSFLALQPSTSPLPGFCSQCKRNPPAVLGVGDIEIRIAPPPGWRASAGGRLAVAEFAARCGHHVERSAASVAVESMTGRGRRKPDGGRLRTAVPLAIAYWDRRFAACPASVPVAVPLKALVVIGFRSLLSRECPARCPASPSAVPLSLPLEIGTTGHSPRRSS